MNDEEAFDAELENLESTLDRARQADAFIYQEHEAIRRRFEESEVWNEHKRWHEEQGTRAQLVVQETEVPVAPPPEVPADSATPHAKLVRFGVCQCQPFNALMQLDDRGQVVAGAPSLEEPPVYGASSGAATLEYSSQGSSPSGAYQIDPSLNKDLYR